MRQIFVSIISIMISFNAMAVTICGEIEYDAIKTDDVPGYTDKEYTWHPTSGNGSYWTNLLGSGESANYSYGCLECDGTNNGQNYAHTELYNCTILSNRFGCVEHDYFNGTKCVKCETPWTLASLYPGHTNGTCDAGCERMPDGGDGIFQILVGSGNNAYCEPVPHGCNNPYHYDTENKLICEWGYRNVSDIVGYPLCLRAPSLTYEVSSGNSWSGERTGAYQVYGTSRYDSAGLFTWYCPADTYLNIKNRGSGHATGNEIAECLPCPNGGWRRPRNPFKDSLADCTVLSGSDETGSFEYTNITKPKDDISNYVGDKQYQYECSYRYSQWNCSYLYCNNEAFTVYSTWSGTYDDNNPEACYAE